MKKVIIASILAIATTAFAGTNCRQDWQGRYVCTSDDGYTTTTRKDWMGNTRIDDNYGNSVTCRQTWNGQTRCD